MTNSENKKSVPINYVLCCVLIFTNFASFKFLINITDAFIIIIIVIITISTLYEMYMVMFI